MSRPKPKVLLELTDTKTYRTEQILAADAVYAVFYDNKPINLRNVDSLRNLPGPKYKKNSFSNKGHAFNLKDKLNKMFKTNKFSVVKLTQGVELIENGDTD